ncbi:MAG: hypothetical protein RR319_06890, partial [Bacteroides sp.]
MSQNYFTLKLFVTKTLVKPKTNSVFNLWGLLFAVAFFFVNPSSALAQANENNFSVKSEMK